MSYASTMHDINTFETTSRKLEQFLFVHDIKFMSWHKDNDGMTVWEYSLTPETMKIINEYREILKKREGKLTR